MLLAAVTNQELLAGQLVKVILALLLLLGAGVNLRLALKMPGAPGQLSRLGLAIFFLLLALPVARWIHIDGSLLLSPAYTVGTTTGFCEAFAKGKAVAFEYEAGGQRYQNCNTFHPIPVDSIVVPGGKYYVRYSVRYPEKGRIDFHRIVN